MNDSLTWIIFGIGYIPMHFMVPLMLAFMTGTETPEQRKGLLKYIGIEGTVTLALLAVAAALLFDVNKMYALGVLLIGPLLPLAGLWWYRKRNGIRWKAA